MSIKYLQDPEIQAAGENARQSEIRRLVKAGFSNELATAMIDSFITILRKNIERDILEHGSGGTPLFKRLSR